MSPAHRERITLWAYATDAGYAAGGSNAARGLFDWEVSMMARPEFPQAGHVLVLAAGGGREVAPLVARGYRVTAVEPCASLIAGVAERFAVCTRTGSYRDLVDAAFDARGPLTPLRGERFDAVILGWGSVMHVLGEDARVAVLGALRALAPEAPVLLSYLAADAQHDAPELEFVFTNGFFERLSEAQVRRVADRSGYEVVACSREPYGHALFRARPEAPPPLLQPSAMHDDLRASPLRERVQRALLSALRPVDLAVQRCLTAARIATEEIALAQAPLETRVAGRHKADARAETPPQRRLRGLLRRLLG